MKKELELTDDMIQRNDEIDNAAQAFACVLAEKELEWNMTIIADITDSAKITLNNHGNVVRHPGVTIDEDGIQKFDDETQFDLTTMKKTDHTMFVLSIIDNGQHQRMLIHPKIDGIAALSSTAIRAYLDEHGVDVGAVELYTGDGYAKVLIVSLADPDADESIWSYSFDGDESLEHALERLISYQTNLESMEHN